MESFRIACGAVFPMVFYMALGTGVRRAGVVDEGFLNRLTAMAFKVFFPILMLKNIYWAEAAGGMNLRFVFYALVSVLLLIALCMLLMLFATPIATSSYPMAQSMGGDGSLAGELVALTNMGSVVTLFLFIFTLSRMGLL